MQQLTFSWQDEPIQDISKWASDSGEPMIKYKAERSTPNMVTGQLDIESYEGKMPETFWNSLHMANGWHYTKL